MATSLQLRFEDPAVFRAEYENNLSKGGVFVRSDAVCSMRDVVVVEIELAWCGRTERLDAEVVHRVEGGPAGGGLAVQFLRPAAAVRERFASYLGPEPDQTEVISAEDLADALGDAPSASGAERRASTRTVARVPAELATTQVSLRGHTRDISDAGVLVSVDGSDVSVGEQVELALHDPETGRPVEISGRVARHVEGEGTVAAVAVEFDDPGRKTLARLVKNVQSREEERSGRGISGPIEELGSASPIEVFGRSAPVGTLTLTSGNEEGVVGFEKGALRYARLGSLRGTKALARMIGWHTGRFEFHAHVDELPDENPVPLEGALLEAARQIDEARHAQLEALPPKARLRLEPGALEREGASLAKLEQAVVDLVAARFTVRRLLDVIPESDADILAAVAHLLDLGVVTLE